MDDPNADTEWNDALRKHGILPPKEPSEREKEYEQWDAAVEAERERNPLQDKSLDELDELEDEFDDDRVLQMYREKRMQEMREDMLRKRFGQVFDVSETDFVREVTEASKNSLVVVHLYKP